MSDFAGGGAFVFDPSSGGGPSTPSPSIQSKSGVWTVPGTVAVGDVVYVTGVFTADKADKSALGTMPGVAVVIAKPTPITATILYMGEAAVFAGLVAGSDYFVASAGAISVTPPSLLGEVVQRVGVAISSTTLLFDPEQVSVVLDP